MHVDVLNSSPSLLFLIYPHLECKSSAYHQTSICFQVFVLAPQLEATFEIWGQEMSSDSEHSYTHFDTKH